MRADRLIPFNKYIFKRRELLCFYIIIIIIAHAAVGFVAAQTRTNLKHESETVLSFTGRPCQQTFADEGSYSLL